jgi:hypothetical protein
VFTFVVKPACTLIITRRLYKIASLRSVEGLTRKEVGLRACFETKCLAYPARNIMILRLSGSSGRACPLLSLAGSVRDLNAFHILSHLFSRQIILIKVHGLWYLKVLGVTMILLVGESTFFSSRHGQSCCL